MMSCACRLIVRATARSAPNGTAELCGSADELARVGHPYSAGSTCWAIDATVAMICNCLPFAPIFAVKTSGNRHAGGAARLRSQVDAQLRTQAAEWHQFTASADLSTASALERTARRFLVNQRYHAESLINVVQVDGGRTVTNDSSVVGLEGGAAPQPRRAGGPARLPRGPVDRLGARGGKHAGVGPADLTSTTVGSERCASETR